MVGFIELQRNLLKEVDTIELAISERLAKNPHILPGATNESKRPYKQTLLQQHEVAYFQNKFKKHCHALEKNLHNEDFEAELSYLSDPKFTFSSFDETINSLKVKHTQDSLLHLQSNQDLKKMYSMYSSGLGLAQKSVDRHGKEKVRVKRKFILSSAAEHIDLDTIFSPEETFGKQLDLLPFYQTYKTLNANFTTYLQYLHDFHLPLPENLSVYQTYLEDLNKYLISFIERSQPLFDVRGLLQDLEKEFVGLKSNMASGVEEEDGSVYCQACDKKFAKISVYKGHLPGKKHKKNQQILDATGSTKKHNESEKLEFMLQKLSEHLSKVRENTISNTERRDAMTDREKLIEIASIAGEESDYTTVNESEDSEDEKDQYDDDGELVNLKDLPLGADGKPIPYWLYKLQGLHKTYKCEICGNISYKGRVSFDKHFASTKHIYGLKCLGIAEDYMKLFVNIDRIEEAIILWKKLKKSNRIKEGDEENAIEVEDNEGNVMSEKDYLDLKKQGLL